MKQFLQFLILLEDMPIGTGFIHVSYLYTLSSLLVISFLSIKLCSL
ncbi:hypothetical protein EMIT0180MI3_30343 [Priestia megaterium]